MNKRKHRRDKIARLISWGHWFTFFNVLVVLTIGTLYIEGSAQPETFLGWLYLIISWLGHFAFLPFVVFIILIFPFCLVVPYTRIIRGIATLVASFGLIALVADALFFRQYGYHLNTYSLTQLATDAETVFAGASFLILIGVLLTFVLLLVFELGLANIAWKRLDKLRGKPWGRSASSLFVLCFFASHSIHIWADAAFYKPITKQDDMFPLSYPTTAKTLMSKHGLLVETRQAVTQDLLRRSSRIKLNYPAEQLLCARVTQSPATLLVSVTRFSAEELARLQQELPELSAYNSPVLGQFTPDSGLFELLYGLPDLYLPAIQEQSAEPAYFSALRDFQISFNNLTPDTLPKPLHDFESIGVSQATAGISIAHYNDLSDDLFVTVRSALQNQQRVIVVGLTPSNNSKHAEHYAIEALQVPVFTSANVAWREQPLVVLSDIMPTILANYVRCANNAASFSVGINLASRQRKLPLMTSYGTDLVVYKRDITSVIEADAKIRSFSNETHELMPNVSPATPILVDGIRKLKRFSKD